MTTQFPTRRYGYIVGAVLFLIAFYSAVTVVGASQLVLVQSIFGKLNWSTSPGPICVCFGRETDYDRRIRMSFSADKDDKGQIEPNKDNRIKIQFYDGALGHITGSMNFELPANPTDLSAIHQQFPTQEALIDGLLRPALNKTIFMTGPLMTSHDSYKEKKSQLVQYIEDQVQNGIYSTVARQVEQVDPITKETHKVTIAEIAIGDNGMPKRAEEGQLARYHIRASNFAVEDMGYEPTVLKQIETQQSASMAVQTAIANATKAQQDALTAEADGKAKAATAKWKQEELNAQIVSAADGLRRKAELEKQGAEFTKQRDILLGEGEAEKRRLIMSADGALEQKLSTLVKINEVWATRMSEMKVPITPSTVFGGSGTSGGGNAFADFMNLQNAAAVKALNVNPNLK